MNTDKIFAESIANEYSKKDTSKVVALEKLDKRAKLPSLIFSLAFGIIGALILGVGMCLAMQVIGNNTPASFVLGIVIGIFGIICCAINYPTYKILRKKGMDKYASDIIALANKISDGE